tara:strand:+ start:341 stop:1030 length:690 start_codon:yes stop_codon:yes gene_type:complete
MNNADRYLPLFASNVFQLHIDYDLEVLKTNKSFIYAANQYKKHEDENYRALEQFPNVRDHLIDRFKELSNNFLKLDSDFIITTSWFTITEEGDGGDSQYHFHKNSFYSGVLYYDEYKEDSAPIEFMTPLEFHADFYLEPREYDLATSTAWQIQPQKNMLVLFPSYLKHQVGKHIGPDPRYSLAFNIVPTGSYGTSDSSIHTEWLTGKPATHELEMGYRVLGGRKYIADN